MTNYYDQEQILTQGDFNAKKSVTSMPGFMMRVGLEF